MIAAGTKLGPYEIESQLGAGGMGEVYRARDTRLERTVAIKVLPQHLSANPDLKQRMEREARAISVLQDPHICTLYDVGAQDGMQFLVMELLQGETLAARLRKGPLPVPELVSVATDVAAGLDRAHKQGIVHRDLKPANIMLTKSGAKLMDFGLAKPTGMAAAASNPAPSFSAATASGPSPASPLTSAGTIVGTMQYMSPEQIEGKPTDARSDIFAFGSVLYEMATGKRAFEGQSQISVASAILEKEPEPITALQPMSPPALEHVVRTCLAKDPEDRYQTAHDIKLELKWIGDAGSSAGLPAPLRAKRLGNRRMLTVAAIVGWAAAIAFIVFAAILSSDVRQGRRPVAAEINAPTGVSVTGAILGAPAISPDEKKLAFLAADSKGVRVWIRDLASGRSEALEGTEGAIFPFWSPDSEAIAFFADGKLRRVPVAGGPVQIICDAADGRGGSWSQNGTIVFTPNIQESLYRVPESGGTPQRVTSAKPGWTNRNPFFLPDGEHFLFLGSDEGLQMASAGLYVGTLNGGEPRLLLERASNVQYSAGHLLYFKDGNLLAQRFDPAAIKMTGEPIPVAESLDYWAGRYEAYFAASAGGMLVYMNSTAAPLQPTWADSRGQPVGTIGEPGFYSNPQFSPDGSTLALVRSDKNALNSDIWISDVKHGTFSRATFVPSAFISYALSPDGKSLAVAAIPGGSLSKLWIQPLTGEAAQQEIAELPNWTVLTDWSRDGRYLFGDVQNEKTREDIFFVDLKGDRKLRMFLQTPASEMYPRISPNGKWLAYLSDESGRYEVYVAAFPGPGGKWQVSTARAVVGAVPVLHWSNDGKTLYFVSQNRIMAAPIENTETFQFGTPQPLPIPTSGLAGFAPVPTPGRFLLLTPAGAPQPSPIHLVLNWAETLRK